MQMRMASKPGTAYVSKCICITVAQATTRCRGLGGFRAFAMRFRFGLGRVHMMIAGTAFRLERRLAAGILFAHPSVAAFFRHR